MSTFSYNGVSLPYAYHSADGFGQSLVMDDSQTDRLYQRFDLKVQGIINVAYKDIIGVEGDNAASLAKNMKKKLLETRKKLSVVVNGVEMIPSTSPSGIDAKNGPMPQAFNYTLLTDESFMFNYSIIANYAPDGAASPVLSNRWTDAQSIDNCDYSTWTRSGKYVIRSDGGITADVLRPTMAMLGVPKSFLRQSSNYTVSPNGLEMQYNIVDKEVFKRPPVPAFEASGTYKETTTRAGGMRYGEVQIRLKGNRSIQGQTSQPELVRSAVFIALAKLNLGGPAAKITRPGFQVMESTMVEINMYENIVTVSMRALMAGRAQSNPNARLGQLASINLLAICETPLSGAQTPAPDYKLDGTASILLQAAAYWDPLLRQRLNPITRQLTQGNEPGAGN